MLKLICLSTLSIVLISCGNNPEDKSAKEQESTTQETHHSEEISGSIELNNGEKWLVNEEMKPFINAEIYLLEEHLNMNAGDHLALAAALKEQNEGLINSCTMEGKSHDELHKWLHPHMQLIDRLSKAELKEESEHIIEEIQASFETYHNYFQ